MIEFNGKAVTEEILNGGKVWMIQNLWIWIDEINHNINSWKAKDAYLIKSPFDVKHIDHYYTLKTWLDRYDISDKYNKILDKLVLQRLFLLDGYTYKRLEKKVYPLCAPCKYECVFDNFHGTSSLVRCNKRTIKI